MANSTIEFVSYHSSFENIIGAAPSAELLAVSEDGSPAYHEACIYHAASSSVYVTSNQVTDHQSRFGKQVKLWRIIPAEAHGGPKLSRIMDVTPNELKESFLNGGVNFGSESILMCAQGSLDPEHHSGLVIVSTDDHSVKPLVSNFYGIPFNSINDVVVHPKDESIWFTDPCYGHHQGIRPSPQLPNQVYRYDPNDGSIRAVADGFLRPNGICFSPDLKTVYITDTGAIHGSPDVAIDPAGPSSIYAFDLVGKHLLNRRLFAFAPGKFPDGIKCDLNGNVYAGCGDGVEVWNSEGVLLGLVKTPGGVANFCFGKNGTMYCCNEAKFWQVNLNGNDVRGALLGL